MNFNNLNYTQNSVSNRFSNGGSIYNASNQAVRFTKVNGQNYILDNRTALSKEMNGYNYTKVKYVPYKYCKSEFHRKNTGNGY